jgi:hypothetical protein
MRLRGTMAWVRGLCGVALLLVGLASMAGTDDLAGHYYLRSVREVGSELVLGTDGRFRFGLSYGAVDQMAEGTWVREGDTVLLQTDAPLAAGFSLDKSSKQLLGAYGTEPDKPTLLAVRVSTPRLGWVWSGMQITAEFNNGLTRSGVTGESGMLGFLARTDAPWTGAMIRRIAVAYPAGGIGAEWFDVDPNATRGVEISFEPGALAPPAFETARYRMETEASTPALTLLDHGAGRPGWRYVRQ